MGLKRLHMQILYYQKLIFLPFRYIQQPLSVQLIHAFEYTMKQGKVTQNLLKFNPFLTHIFTRMKFRYIF